MVALLNSTGGIEALYVFLSGVGFAIFVIFLLGPLYRKLCHKTNSFQDGPSPVLMTVTLLLVLSCAFVTDILGIHPIFGGFIAGLIIPHEHDLSIKITEKIEDMVNIVFLPLVSLILHIYLYYIAHTHTLSLAIKYVLINLFFLTGSILRCQV